MNIVVAFKQFIINLTKKPLRKMSVEEVAQRFLKTFRQRKKQVAAKRHTIQKLVPLQKKEFKMRLDKASTDFHLKGMLALVVSMKKNDLFWTEGARIFEECEKSIQHIQDFIANNRRLLATRHVSTIESDEAYRTYFQEIHKSDQLTKKHLDYLESDGKFIKKDLIARAKERLEAEDTTGIDFQTLFQKKKQWITSQTPYGSIQVSTQLPPKTD